MKTEEPKILKEARYALFFAEGKLYSASQEWDKARQVFLKEYMNHYNVEFKNK
jgi:hypothetical protein